MSGPGTGETDANTEQVRVSWLWVLVFWWTIAAVASVSKISWWHLTSPETEADFTLWGRVAYQFVFYSCWALLTPLAFRFSGWLLTRRHRLVQAGYVVLAGLATAILMGFLRSWTHNLEHKAQVAHGLEWIARDSIGRVHEDLMIFVAVLAVGLAAHYYRQRESQHSAAASLRARLSDAQLHALQMQLNPHFLFNALNSISALVERDPHSARTVVARLSNLLRRSLDVSGRQEVTLDEELQSTQSYLDIMKIRSGDNLSVRIDVAPGLYDAMVPAFLLQPLVENAFEHGVSCIEGKGEVSIRAARIANRLMLTIEDNGPGPAGRTKGTGHGIGLENTRARLRGLYGDAFDLKLRQCGDTGAIVEVELPYHTTPSRRAI